MELQFSKRCPRCGYVRNPVDKGPAHLCSQCGYVLATPEQVKEVEDRAAVDAAKKIALKEEKEAKHAELRSRNALTVRDLLVHFVGERIGINLPAPDKFGGALLASVQADHFIVVSDGMEHFVPIAQVIRATSATKGMVSGGVLSGSFPLVVKVFDFVIYKGAVGVGVSIPLDQ